MLPSTTQQIKEHIASFKRRASHYDTNNTTKTYLSENLNVKKMVLMFKEINPDCSVSYESYRKIFTTNFKLRCLEKEIETTHKKQKEKLAAEIKRITVENKLHKQRAQEFYSRKRKSKLASSQDVRKESICMDYGKNLPIPNISTNDAYYKRQLSMYLFNVHVLSTSESVFYVYPENGGKKGSDDVSSMLYNFLYNHLDPRVRILDIFCDSCGGQTKNYTLFRFLHHVVHEQKRLDYVKVTFSVRGHSYMEPDENMGIIKHKTRYETPDELWDLIRSSRIKPSPFMVTQIGTQNQRIFRQWTKHLATMYKKVCCPNT